MLELPVIVYSVRSAWRGAESEGRIDADRALHGLLQQGVLAGLLAITWWEGWWTAASVGLRWSPWALGVGVGAWFLVRWVHDRRRSDPTDAATYVTGLRRMWPRARYGQASVVATLAVNPWTEELVTRGVFVHHLHLATGNAVLAVFFGLVVNQVLHAYQGVRSLPWHAGFYLATVLLLYSPWGLLAAIVLHSLADLAHADGRPTLAWIRAARRR